MEKMKIVLLIMSYFALAAAAPSLDEQWISFKAENKKKYLNASEEKLRLSIFQQNMKKIEEHNAKYAKGEVTYSLSMNQFGDLSTEEFAAKFTGYKKKTPKTKNNLLQKFKNSLNAKLPESIDWRSKGAVTPVKNQGSCQGCWSFSATGALEGQLFRSTGKLVSLSEQQLIDCSTFYDNKGCEGGRMESAFEYLKDAGGIMSEDNYPFLGSDGSCVFSLDSAVNGSKVTSYAELPEEDEEALKVAVATVGPISAAVAASSDKFSFYKGGIMTSSGCGANLDHAVLIVGYGTERDGDYWIIKNSWTAKWGDNGYMKLARNQGNVCGVASSPSYPILEKTSNGDSTTQPPQPQPQPQPTTEPSPSNAMNTVISSANLIFTSLFLIYFSIKI